MNLNDTPEKLIEEEQNVLNNLISRMDQVLEKLDNRMRTYVSEAKNADISVNLDLYLSKLMAQQGINDTAENRKEMLKARDELYEARLLLQYENSMDCGIDEYKVGLHSCMHGSEQLVASWKMPLFRHYIIDDSSIEYESIVDGKYGEKYHTNYKLLVKNTVKLRFTRVAQAINMFPGIFDDITLEALKETGFFSEAFIDDMIDKFDPEKYDPEAAARIISDEFLQELIERRSTPEFKNIVFSIQKKQGEIIQAPYNRDMIVQGCAGSGKSMIMMHRLPILLYDNPDRLKRDSLYIVTPSPMYIQMAENMRSQLEISDINMGTIEQYYDYCIAKYPGHKANEYGKINFGSRITSENEQYVYSKECIADILSKYDELENYSVSLDKANAMFYINDDGKYRRSLDTYSQRISNRLLKLQNVIKANSKVINNYFTAIKEVLDSLNRLSMTLSYRKNNVTRVITQRISKIEEEILKKQNELENTIEDEKKAAIYFALDAANERIDLLKSDLNSIEVDLEHFTSLMKVNSKVKSVIEPFSFLKKEYSQNTIKELYEAIELAGQLIGGYYMLSWECSKFDDKYMYYLGAISKEVEKVKDKVSILQVTTENYLDCDYYISIKEEHDNLLYVNSNAVKLAYEMIMKNIGVKPSENGNIRAIKCSPYIYLQALYLYHGSPSYRESLLAIDEAQGIAPEEIRLLKNINGNDVIFNMYGDIYQHIEGSKGIDSWDDYKGIIDFDYYEMLENYRNASQITEYTNRFFHMNMNPINTPGKGVHDLETETAFYSEMVTQLMDTQRVGLAAILVKNDAEARKLLDMFSTFKQKFHNMTDEEFSIHHTRWNIINIDDAKGLEFSSVVVLSGRMSRNEKYIAFTRALDDLYVYPEVLNIKGFEKKPRKQKEENATDNSEYSDKKIGMSKKEKDRPKHGVNQIQKDMTNSEVKRFFVEKGLEVLDTREQGGRLWVIGEKESIRSIVNTAIAKFGISGKYSSGKETNNMRGWYTKTDK